LKEKKHWIVSTLQVQKKILLLNSPLKINAYYYPHFLELSIVRGHFGLIHLKMQCHEFYCEKINACIA